MPSCMNQRACKVVDTATSTAAGERLGRISGEGCVELAIKEQGRRGGDQRTDQLGSRGAGKNVCLRKSLALSQQVSPLLRATLRFGSI